MEISTLFEVFDDNCSVVASMFRSLLLVEFIDHGTKMYASLHKEYGTSRDCHDRVRNTPLLSGTFSFQRRSTR